MVNCRQALCKELRDKVYGVIGLAPDCYGGFRMDYCKTLYDIWKDTIPFKNFDGNVHQGDILKFGKLARDSLGSQDITKMKDISEVLRWICLGRAIMVDLQETTLVLRVPTCLVGRIPHLGPSLVDVTNDLWKTAE